MKFRVHFFWEGHFIFVPWSTSQIYGRDFKKKLWASQTIWTLPCLSMFVVTSLLSSFWRLKSNSQASLSFNIDFFSLVGSVTWSLNLISLSIFDTKFSQFISSNLKPQSSLKNSDSHISNWFVDGLSSGFSWIHFSMIERISESWTLARLSGGIPLVTYQIQL